MGIIDEGGPEFQGAQPLGELSVRALGHVILSTDPGDYLGYPIAAERYKGVDGLFFTAYPHTPQWPK